jgi:hypothetical protein
MTSRCSCYAATVVVERKIDGWGRQWRVGMVVVRWMGDNV